MSAALYRTLAGSVVSRTTIGKSNAGPAREFDLYVVPHEPDLVTASAAWDLAGRFAGIA